VLSLIPSLGFYLSQTASTFSVETDFKGPCELVMGAPVVPGRDIREVVLLFHLAMGLLTCSIGLRGHVEVVQPFEQHAQGLGVKTLLAWLVGPP
jgi:hypothetical protein